jgi:hypothetical protein
MTAVGSAWRLSRVDTGFTSFGSTGRTAVRGRNRRVTRVCTPGWLGHATGVGRCLRESPSSPLPSPSPPHGLPLLLALLVVLLLLLLLLVPVLLSPTVADDRAVSFAFGVAASGPPCSAGGLGSGALRIWSLRNARRAVTGSSADGAAASEPWGAEGRPTGVVAAPGRWELGSQCSSADGILDVVLVRAKNRSCTAWIAAGDAAAASMRACSPALNGRGRRCCGSARCLEASALDGRYGEDECLRATCSRTRSEAAGRAGTMPIGCREALTCGMPPSWVALTASFKRTCTAPSRRRSSCGLSGRSRPSSVHPMLPMEGAGRLAFRTTPWLVAERLPWPGTAERARIANWMDGAPQRVRGILRVRTGRTPTRRGYDRL